ncbi:hypothetical protein [Streptomyces fulvorobeus]|uniref:Uncharacterized protein n=1 Tax=Streptomyces fulvorobeus TaxID=284028 RepID=A0A7J0C6T9_9ACTN|nr:hypothetical protein [Streptomyces fulvorobeus]NYE41883.1 hypothetical protein [Streptomyces fulvorobeus]GFM98255.1 hypothetical protein Sfulv_30660 [Streptomyces fulvorobeus]
MRMLLTARMNTEHTNRALADGSLPKLIADIVEDLKPEAAYFTPMEGDRTCMFVFDMAESAQLPPISEPFFLAGARVSVTPVMNLDDLRTGLGNLKR